jgi:hypothetical protein
MAQELPVVPPAAPRGGDRGVDRPDGSGPRALRPTRGGATEIVRVIQFLWAAGDDVQPVFFVARQLLD